MIFFWPTIRGLAGVSMVRFAHMIPKQTWQQWTVGLRYPSVQASLIAKGVQEKWQTKTTPIRSNWDRTKVHDFRPDYFCFDQFIPGRCKTQCKKQWQVPVAVCKSRCDSWIWIVIATVFDLMYKKNMSKLLFICQFFFCGIFGKSQIVVCQGKNKNLVKNRTAWRRWIPVFGHDGNWWQLQLERLFAECI